MIAPLDVTMRAMVENAALEGLGAAGPAAQLFGAAWKAYTANYCRVLKFCGDHGALHDVHPIAHGRRRPEPLSQARSVWVDLCSVGMLASPSSHPLEERARRNVVSRRYMIWPDIYTKVERMPLDIVVSNFENAANGHSLLDRRNLAKTGVVDDRTGEITAETRPMATVLLDVDADAFIERFLAAMGANATV